MVSKDGIEAKEMIIKQVISVLLILGTFIVIQLMLWTDIIDPDEEDEIEEDEILP